MDRFEEFLKNFDVSKNVESLYGLNAIFKNMKKDLFDNISKLFRQFYNYIKVWKHGPKYKTFKIGKSTCYN